MNFTKLEATGNDFVLVDARSLKYDWTKLAQDMCHRHFGVGADGLILVMDSEDANLKMRILNNDGSEAEICGNGLRCLTKYVIDRQIASGPNLSIETLAGIKKVQAYISHGKVFQAKINMGKPIFTADDIPVTIRGKGRNKEVVDIIPILDYVLPVQEQKLSLSFVSMGNPHAVSFPDNEVVDFPLSQIGPQVERNTMFPERINFEIASVVNRKSIKARVWERGVGETLACGSGACAIAVIARVKGLIDEEVDIKLPGGKLTINWDGSGDVYLTGPVEEVFEGVWPK